MSVSELATQCLSAFHALLTALPETNCPVVNTAGIRSSLWPEEANCTAQLTLLSVLACRRQFRVTTFDEQSGLDPAPFADLFGESDDLFDVSAAAACPCLCLLLACCSLEVHAGAHCKIPCSAVLLWKHTLEVLLLPCMSVSMVWKVTQYWPPPAERNHARTQSEGRASPGAWAPRRLPGRPERGTHAQDAVKSLGPACETAGGCAMHAGGAATLLARFTGMPQECEGAAGAALAPNCSSCFVCRCAGPALPDAVSAPHGFVVSQDHRGTLIVRSLQHASHIRSGRRHKVVNRSAWALYTMPHH